MYGSGNNANIANIKCLWKTRVLQPYHPYVKHQIVGRE